MNEIASRIADAEPKGNLAAPPPVLGQEFERSLLQLHAVTDIAHFWTILQALLQKVVPHDALVLYLNFLDFASSWQAAEILATPNARRPVTWFQNRREVDMTPQFVLSHDKPIDLYRLSDVVPNPRELQRTAFFREFLAPSGWHHLLVVLFWRGNQVGSEIALRRTKEQGDFTDAEVATMRALYPHIDTILNRLLTLEEERSHRRQLEAFNQNLPFALMFLDWDLRPIYVNRAALEHCARWNLGAAKAQAYRAREVFFSPVEIVGACSQMKMNWLAQQSGESAHLRNAIKVAHPREAGFTASVRLHTDDNTRAAYPGFVVHIDHQDLVIPQGLTAKSLLCGLTAAERDLAQLICAGLSNQEIAVKRHKSVKTIKGQLTSIYRKTGVRTRSQLIIQLR